MESVVAASAPLKASTRTGPSLFATARTAEGTSPRPTCRATRSKAFWRRAGSSRGRGMAVMMAGRPAPCRTALSCARDPRSRRDVDQHRPARGARPRARRPRAARRGPAASPPAPGPPPGGPPARAPGGAAFRGYALAGPSGRLPTLAASDQPLPEIRLALHDLVVAWDRANGAAWLVGRAGADDLERLRRRRSELLDRLLAPEPTGAPTPAPAPDPPRAFASNLDRRAFEAMVGRVRDEIARGGARGDGPHQGHAAARRHARGGPCAGHRAAGQREGPRRERHDRGRPAQRPRPRLHPGQRARAAPVPPGADRRRPAPRLHGHGPAPDRPRRARPARRA